MLIAFVPLSGIILYGWWHNRQVDKSSSSVTS